MKQKLRAAADRALQWFKNPTNRRVVVVVSAIAGSIVCANVPAEYQTMCVGFNKLVALIGG